MKTILSVNAGSSSVKISVYSASSAGQPKCIADQSVKGLTSPPCKLKYQRKGDNVNDDDDVTERVHSQDDAFEVLLDTLISDKGLPEIQSAQDIDIICHRIVHGGDYQGCQVIKADTFQHLEELSDLAPLHNGASLGIVKQCFAALPDSVNVACFDTQFHLTIPTHISTYPINQEVAEKNGLRKYGFHGISFSFIIRSVARFLDKNVNKTNIIALHLGSGASVCAIKDGKSVDTSMGLTPVSGLPGATRSGTVDPSLVFHYTSGAGKLSPASTKHLHISNAEEILNDQSGWNALTGTTNFETIAQSKDPKDKLAFDIFVNRICNYVGSYYVLLEGNVDALVFSGGIGEANARIREEIVKKTRCLGFKLHSKDGELQSGGGLVQDISSRDTDSRVLVCHTDEQYEMARLCTEMAELWA